jgi:hypothetical protein
MQCARGSNVKLAVVESVSFASLECKTAGAAESAFCSTLPPVLRFPATLSNHLLTAHSISKRLYSVRNHTGTELLTDWPTLPIVGGTEKAVRF